MDIIITRLEITEAEGKDTVISVSLSETSAFMRILPLSLKAIMLDSRVSAATATLSMRFACSVSEYFARFDNFMNVMRAKDPSIQLDDNCSVEEFMHFVA